MSRLEMVDNLVVILNDNLSSDEFEDTISAIAVIEGVNEELVFGAYDRPDYLEGLVEAFQNNVGYELYQDCSYEFIKFRIALDVLLYDVICNVAENGMTFKVTKPVKVLLEDEMSDGSIKITLNECSCNSVEDYNSIFEEIFYKDDYNTEYEDLESDTEDEYEGDYNEESAEGVEENNRQEKNTNSDKARNTVWDDLINAKVQGILSVYKELYEVGYQVFTPVGLLYDKGIIRHTKDGNKKEENALLQGVFESINTKVNRVFSTNKLPNGNCKPKLEYVSNDCYYFPNYQLRNIFGVDSEDNKYSSYISGLKDKRIVKYSQLEKYLKEELFDILYNTIVDTVKKYMRNLTLAEANKALEPIICALETVIVITEYIKGTNIKLKIATGGKYPLTREIFQDDILRGKIFGSSTEIEQFIYNNGVYTVNFVMDRKKYDGYPLFAFQALEAVKKTGKPDWGSVVLGKNVDNDTIVRRSFLANTDFLICLIAGSRSGKGVFTLNLLGSAMGAGYPIHYTDFKPDMSSTFYNIASRNNTEMFTFDGSWEAKEFPRRANIYEDAESIPQELVDVGLDVKEFILLVSYFRSMELAVLLARARQKAVNNNCVGLEELGGERLIFVFDELELFSIKYRDLFETFNKVDGRVNSMVNNLMRGMKPAEKATYIPYNYIEDFKSWATGVISSFASCMSATFGQGKVSLFMIWQHTDTENLGMPIKNLAQSIINNSIRIVGNGTLSGSGSKTLGAMNFKGTDKEKYFGQYCFAIANQRGGEITPDTSTVFKPYLLLNEVSPQYVNELYGRCPEARELIEVNGIVREDVGFEGYVKELLEVSDLAPILSKSWIVAENFVRLNSLSSSLLSYMYDVHSFKIKKIEVQNFDDEDSGNMDNTDFFDNYYQNAQESKQEDFKGYTSVPYEDLQENIEQNKGTFNMPNGEKVKPTKYDEYIFKHNLFNMSEKDFMDEKSTTKSLNNLSLTLYAHIIECIGAERVSSIAEKDRYLLVNNVLIAPQVTEDIINKLPFDVRSEVEDGRWSSVFVFGYTRHFPNLSELVFSDTRFLTTKIMRDYGVRVQSPENYQNCIKNLFKLHKNLQVVYVGNEAITRDTINGKGFSKQSINEFERAARSEEIDQTCRRTANSNNYRWGLGSFYKNPNIGVGTKVAATVGIGALAMLACANPFGLLAVGYVGGKTIVEGTQTIGGKLKRGIKAFASALKENL